MHQRDYEIALKLIELKKKNGYPEKFRTCWGKNTSERIFKIASLLQLNGLDKGVTLARQSNSDLVLKNIKRDNIKLEAYEYLEKNFNRLQVPVYAELILGLPGETAASWEVGIDQMLSAGLNNQLFIYQAEVYPNTELGSMEYQRKFQIKTTKIKLNEIHCSPREPTWIPEYQHIVTSTYSMTTTDWRMMTNYSLVTMLMHSMKAGIYIIAYMHKRLGLPYGKIFNLVINSEKKYLKSLMDYFKDYSKKLLTGEGRGLFLEEYSDVYLEAEEVAFLKITQNKESFYTDIYEELITLVPSKYQIEFREVIKFQSLLMPELVSESDLLAVEFETNIPEFCYSIFINKDITIKNEPTILRVYRTGYVSMHEFTKKQLIWARKSGTILFNTDLNERIKESIKISYDIDNFDDEKTFKISLFEPNRIKFEKFDSIKQIPVMKG
jgi:putative methyltransferase